MDSLFIDNNYKYEYKKIKISDLLDYINHKQWNINPEYQRNDPWSEKNKTRLIDSIFHNYFIPPIIISNNQVIDGKQRIQAISKFKNNNLYYFSSQSNKIYFKDLQNGDQSKFLNFEINYVELENLNDEEIRDTFLRINETSIKLNKDETRMAKCIPAIREFIENITKNDSFTKLCKSKSNDKRFKQSNLIIRLLAILAMPSCKKGVRSYMDQLILDNKLLTNEEINQGDFIKTFEDMYKIFGTDTIPNKSFNTIFEAIFIAYYNNIKNRSSYLAHKDKIKQSIKKIIKEISDDQMGGGIKFDSKVYIDKRIEKVEKILQEYELDTKRTLSHDEKLKIWNENKHRCKSCNKEFTNFNEVEFDHIQPYSKGGKTQVENTQMLCKNCNRSKSNKQ